MKRSLEGSEELPAKKRRLSSAEKMFLEVKQNWVEDKYEWLKENLPEIMRAHPNLRWFHYYLGESYLRTQDSQLKGLQHLQIYLNCGGISNAGRAKLQCASVLHNLGEYDKAESLYRDIMSNKDSVDSYRYLAAHVYFARMLRVTNRIAEIHEIQERIVKIAPEALIECFCMKRYKDFNDALKEVDQQKFEEVEPILKDVNVQLSPSQIAYVRWDMLTHVHKQFVITQHEDIYDALLTHSDDTKQLFLRINRYLTNDIVKIIHGLLYYLS